MSDVAAAGNLRESGVKPLRNSARTASSRENKVQVFDVEKLKNGESMDLGSVSGTGESSSTIRRRYLGGKPVPTAQASQDKKADTPLEEQIDQLRKIRKSALEYEAFFVDHLVKQMRPSPLAKVPGGETFSDIAEQPFRDFLTQAGGFGLADGIVQQVARQEGLEQTLRRYPGIMGPNWRPELSAAEVRKETGSLGPRPENQRAKAGEGRTGPAEGE